MKRLIFLMLALLVAGSASAATKVQVMTDGVIDVDRLPTISFFQEGDPASPELGQLWWNNATKQLKVAGALGVYAFNSTSLVEWDTTPEAFSFTDVANATTSTVYTSTPITVSGINWPAPISVSGDASAKYSVNNATATAANGTVASGDEVRAVVTSSASDGAAVNATVTIGGVSDAFGVTTAADEPSEIFDDFSSDTTANYTALNTPTLSIGSGVATSSAAYGRFYHETSTGSNDNYAQAVLKNTSGSANGLIVRCDGTNGYIVRLLRGETDRFALLSFNSTEETFIALITYTGGKTWATGAAYLARASMVGSTVELEIDWNNDGDFLGTNESDMTTRTSTTYVSGQYVGFGWSDGGGSAALDGFSGGSVE